MGFFDDLLTWFGFKKKQAKILCVGLDNSGKTTIIDKLKPEAVSPPHDIILHQSFVHILQSKSQLITPTIGFSVDIFTHSK